MFLAGVLIILPFIVYLNSLHGDFVFDDVPLISQNQNISGLRDLTSIFDLKKGTFYTLKVEIQINLVEVLCGIMKY